MLNSKTHFTDIAYLSFQKFKTYFGTLYWSQLMFFKKYLEVKLNNNYTVHRWYCQVPANNSFYLHNLIKYSEWTQRKYLLWKTYKVILSNDEDENWITFDSAITMGLKKFSGIFCFLWQHLGYQAWSISYSCGTREVCKNDMLIMTVCKRSNESFLAGLSSLDLRKRSNY